MPFTFDRNGMKATFETDISSASDSSLQKRAQPGPFPRTLHRGQLLMASPNIRLHRACDDVDFFPWDSIGAMRATQHDSKHLQTSEPTGLFDL